MNKQRSVVSMCELIPNNMKCGYGLTVFLFYVSNCGCGFHHCLTCISPLLTQTVAYLICVNQMKAALADPSLLSRSRITRLLIDQDGPEWREKLPDIPLVPISAQQHRREEAPTPEVLQARAEKAAQDTGALDITRLL